MRVLLISHLYPAPGYDRHLFVHEQALALRAAGAEVSVVSPVAITPPGRRSGRLGARQHSCSTGSSSTLGSVASAPPGFRALRRVHHSSALPTCGPGDGKFDLIRSSGAPRRRRLASRAPAGRRTSLPCTGWT